MSHVQDLAAEVQSISDGYLDLQRTIGQIAFEAQALQQRWAATGLTSATPNYDYVNGEVAECHKLLGQVENGAFNVSAQMAGLARGL